MKRTDIPIQPRTEWTFTYTEFRDLLGLPNDQHVTTVQVSAAEVKVITWPGGKPSMSG